MEAFLSLAFNLPTALHTLLNRQAREVDESSPWGDYNNIFLHDDSSGIP